MHEREKSFRVSTLVCPKSDREVTQKVVEDLQTTDHADLTDRTVEAAVSAALDWSRRHACHYN